LASDVLLGSLGSSGSPAAFVLGLEHLVDVVELQLGLELRRARQAPVHLLRPRARIPLAEREQDPDPNDEAEQDEDSELVDPASVRSSAMTDAVILDALRTPIGRHGGVLASVRPDDLGAHVVRAAVERNGIDPASVDEIYMGCANQAGEDNRNVARMAGLLAGLPVEVPGVTVNRLCASGLGSARRSWCSPAASSR
jgi:Thiolase, N-terminal domain